MLLFLYVTEEAVRKCVLDMPWPPAAECNMITNKQTCMDQTYQRIGWAQDDYRNYGSAPNTCAKFFGTETALSGVPK